MKQKLTFRQYLDEGALIRRDDNEHTIERIFDFLNARKEQMAFVTEKMLRPPLEAVVVDLETEFRNTFRRYKLFKDQAQEPISREEQNEGNFLKQSIGRMIGFIMKKEGFKAKMVNQKEKRGELQGKLKNIFTKTIFYERA